MNRYLIIGSGLVGRLLAWRLITLGHAVDILSKDDFKGTDSAGYVAASMISPATEAVNTEPMVKEIGLASLRLWPEWISELPDPVFYQDKGTLVVAHSGDRAEQDRFMRRAEHVLSQDDFQKLDHHALKDKSADLAENFTEALFVEEEACLDNRQLYQSLTKVLMDSPQCRWAQCDAIDTLNETVIDDLAQKYFNYAGGHYQSTIDCRGNGAKTDLSRLRSVRGEVIRVHAPDVNFEQAVRLLHPRYPLYLAPRANHEYVLGATVIESDDMSPISLRSGLELMSALYSMHKGFAEARVLEMATHCRPAMIDNMPSIKRTSWGFHFNGLYRHGYLFSPALITDFLSVLCGDETNLKFGKYFDV
jgi:glycine oxidase